MTLIKHFARFSSLLTMFLVLSLSANVRASLDNGPLAVVDTATQGVIAALTALEPDARTEESISKLVEEFIVPAIDQEKMAKGALGKHWRRATPEQRSQFIQVFRERQIRTYMGAFKAFSDEQLNFTEEKFNDEGNQAIVKGEFKQTNGNTVGIDFRLYKSKKDDRWYVYDAIIEGLSMLKTYRTQLSEKLQNGDLNSLIAEMQQEINDTLNTAKVD